jgi:hypothetical protein
MKRPAMSETDPQAEFVETVQREVTIGDVVRWAAIGAVSLTGLYLAGRYGIIPTSGPNP